MQSYGATFGPQGGFDRISNSDGARYDDVLPALTNAVDTRAIQTCAAHLRMAAWVARRAGAM